MNLDRMLERCRRDQWSVRDIDFSGTPRPMSEEDEMAVCQLFCDMAVIERLAGALFREQKGRAKDERLRAIFETFVVDEIRHSQAAQMLCDFFDRRHLRTYRPSPSLQGFFPHFVRSVTYLEDDIANAYILGGELILDIALLRSIADYTHDPVCDRVMRLINRDEARHIAIDYFMVEYYASSEYRRTMEARTLTPRDRVAATWTFANVLYWAQPFIRDVFFEPMSRVDPSGKRLREAFKRMQLLGAKPGTTARGFGKFMRNLQEAYHHPLAGRFLRGAVARVAGVGDYIGRLTTESELEEASKKSFEELAADTLSINQDRESPLS